MKYRRMATVAALLMAAACTKDYPESPIKTLQVTDVVVGTGTTATAGKSVTVHYTGWIWDEHTADHHGSKFDSSVDRNQPYTFTLGVGTVIPGWDQGVVGMKVGGKRTLVIPPELAYGDSGFGSIPPKAALIFDIQLLNVQ